MGVNPELNELQKEVTKQRILEAGFRIFSERTIEKVTMADVAEAAGIGVATVYRYYKSKPDLVLAVGSWAWERYLYDSGREPYREGRTAAENYEYFLDAFLDLYRNHRDLLRFNQFFNIYVENEKDLPEETLRPYLAMAEELVRRMGYAHRLAQDDHTLRTDVPPLEMMLTTVHLMLAAVTRYAVGLVYKGGQDPEKELCLLKNMLLREFTAPPG